MIKILFICHGNICRSAAAEYIMRKLIRDAGLSARISADSAATSTEELGNPVYPPMRRVLEGHGIRCEGHSARQMKKGDYSGYDLIIGTDLENLYYMKRICGGDPDGKFRLLMDYTDRPGSEISDPWYTRDFERAYRDVEKGCIGLLSHLQKALKERSPL